MLFRTIANFLFWKHSSKQQVNESDEKKMAGLMEWMSIIVGLDSEAGRSESTVRYRISVVGYGDNLMWQYLTSSA